MEAEDEENPELYEEDEVIDDDDDEGKFWKLLLLIPIFEPMVFLTILSSMLPYFSWTKKLFLDDSILLM